MVKKQKLFQKLIQSPTNIRFDDFITLILAFQFEYKRTTGSHRIYKHPNADALLSLQPDKQGKAKPYQIRQFLKLVEEFDLKLIDEES